jgi:hypothetical protein
MTDGQKDLVRYRMQRAAETLKEARLMLDSDYGNVVELSEADIRADLRKAEEFIAQIESQIRLGLKSRKDAGNPLAS